MEIAMNACRSAIATAGVAVIALAGGVAVSGMMLTGASAQEALEEFVPSNPTDQLALSLGGRLYDNWAAVQYQGLPEETHPLYPADGAQSGGGTWRCKECHGWDNLGADGAYGSGSHYTGIIGVRGMAGKEPSEIAAIIRGEAHGYTEQMIPDNLLEFLSRFISAGQIDVYDFVDRATGLPDGSPAIGAVLYQNVCAICHGFDGRTLNFGDADEPEYLGTVAAGNPPEFFHKAMNGQPGVAMPAIGVILGPEAVANILAFAQTLPTE
jgi:thiosulfate dehydrogenase